ncbi:MAG: thioredoxin [Thermoproteus sp. JCHS_4]|jgi:Predicted thioredoxin/glutaredoxin|nr:MAG: thioredoxin [Thermoproteus sp. JCHS_4]
MAVEVVVHHTCSSSWKLYRDAKARGLQARFVPASLADLRRAVLGIPAVFADGRLVLYDPVTADDLEALLKGSAGRDLPVDEAIQNFVTGVVYNQALLSLALLHKSFRPILADREIAEVLTRARFHGAPDAAEAAAREISRRDAQLFSENREKMLRALAYGLVRELYWLGVSPSNVDAERAAMWIMAKATVGRIGLQYPRPHVDRDIAEAVAAILKERGGHYLEKIAEEQAAISSDRDFLSLFG